MMPLRFRVWHKEKKLMGIVHTLQFLPNGAGCAFAKNLPATLLGEGDCEHGIVMQYTGLKDVHGNEIFEGDILRIIDLFWGSSESHTDRVGKVVWDDRNAQFELQGLLTRNKDADMELEIIGNIYSNPDLLT